MISVLNGILERINKIEVKRLTKLKYGSIISLVKRLIFDTKFFKEMEEKYA